MTGPWPRGSPRAVLRLRHQLRQEPTSAPRGRVRIAYSVPQGPTLVRAATAQLPRIRLGKPDHEPHPARVRAGRRSSPTTGGETGSRLDVTTLLRRLRARPRTVFEVGVGDGRATRMSRAAPSHRVARAILSGHPISTRYARGRAGRRAEDLEHVYAMVTLRRKGGGQPAFLQLLDVTLPAQRGDRCALRRTAAGRRHSRRPFRGSQDGHQSSRPDDPTWTEIFDDVNRFLGHETTHHKGRHEPITQSCSASDLDGAGAGVEPATTDSNCSDHYSGT